MPEGSEAKTYDVVYSRDPRADFVVHRHGCRDIATRWGTADWQIHGVDVEAAIAAEVDVYQAQDQGWERKHFHVMPCVREGQP